MNKIRKENIIKVAFAFVAIFLGFSFIRWTALPYWQMRMAYKGFFDAVIHENTDFLENHPIAFIPNTSIQQKFRFQFLFRVLSANNSGYTKTNSKLYEYAISKLEESQLKKDNFGYFDMSLGIAFDRMGNGSSTPEEAQANYEKANEYFRKARLTLPNFPTVNIQYALTLEKSGKRKEAILLLRDQIALFPDFPNYHYYLGLILVKEKNTANESLSEFETALAEEINLEPNMTMDAYYSFLVYFSKHNDKQRLTTTLNRLKKIDSNQAALYDTVLDMVKSGKKIPPIYNQN
ncbi:MAG: hypothetical protein RL641_576 [Candidatus Parcubacteria bacterium]|jgi:tetratricopeptide (TPR) repeat protein